MGRTLEVECKHLEGELMRVRFASSQDLSAGRNVEEVVRVLDALQTGGLTACNWKRGDATLSPR